MVIAKQLRIVVAMVSVVVLSACNISINRVSTDSLKTYQANVPMPIDRTKAWDVEISPGAASVMVTSDSTNLISGTISYNVNDWKPMIISDNQSVALRQNQFQGIPPLNAQNDWRLRLGSGLPMNLTINAGASKGDWDLGGLSLRNLTWNQGASDVTLRFSQPNPESLEEADIHAGASTMKVQGLANLNAQYMNVDIGAGTLILRFDGRLKRNMDVTLTGGAAVVTIDSGGNPVKVIQDRSLTAVNRGEWSKDGSNYLSTEWAGNTGPVVTVNVTLGAASLELVSGH